MININDLRLSWIWTETFPGTLVDPPKPMSRWGAPGDDAAYAAAFQKARSKEPPLKLPWSEDDPRHEHFFWQYYLENDNPFKVTPAKALRWIVPVRETRLAKIAPASPARFFVETYHYPHGLALVVGARLTNQLALFDMVDAAFEIARNATLKVTWRDKSTEALNLRQFAGAALDRFRTETFGAGISRGVRSANPFTVATIVQGILSPGDESAPKNNPDLHRALEGLAGWNPNWKSTEPDPFSERSLGLRKGPAAHTVYATTLGRVVWFPDSFLPPLSDPLTPPKSKKPSLSCYHRNLMFTSLQTESLARLMTAAWQVWQSNEKISPPMLRLVKAAAGILGRLYGGDQSVYCSFSPAAQLEQNNWIPVLKNVRNEVGILGELRRNRPATAPQT
ncbi:MAG: hypothetical protein WAO00_00310 [Chthoniobacterales bacterium]